MHKYCQETFGAVRPLAPCYHSALALSNASSFSEMQLHFSVSSHLACLADLLGRAKIVSIPLNARTRARDRLFPSPNSTHFFFLPLPFSFLYLPFPLLTCMHFILFIGDQSLPCQTRKTWDILNISHSLTPWSWRAHNTSKWPRHATTAVHPRVTIWFPHITSVSSSPPRSPRSGQSSSSSSGFLGAHLPQQQLKFFGC